MSNQNEKRQDAFLPVEDDALDQISGGIVTSSVPLVNMSSLKRKEFDSAWEQMGYDQNISMQQKQDMIDRWAQAGFPDTAKQLLVRNKL